MTEREDFQFASRIAKRLREHEPVEPDFEARLLAAVRDAARDGRRRRPGPFGGAMRWLVAPRRLTLSPLGGLALAAGLVAVVAWTTLTVSRDGLRAPTAAASDRQNVQFAVVAPAADAVALVGDFNEWDTTKTPMTKGAVEGLWMVTVPLVAGSYQYAFVIDGTTWIADPAAVLAVEDEFGTPSSILTIRGGRT